MIAIVALESRILTSHDRVTGILGAGIVVIARDQWEGAGTVHADIAGAGIIVITCHCVNLAHSILRITCLREASIGRVALNEVMSTDALGAVDDRRVNGAWISVVT